MDPFIYHINLSYFRQLWYAIPNSWLLSGKKRVPSWCFPCSLYLCESNNHHSSLCVTHMFFPLARLWMLLVRDCGCFTVKYLKWLPFKEVLLAWIWPSPLVSFGLLSGKYSECPPGLFSTAFQRTSEMIYTSSLW